MALQESTALRGNVVVVYEWKEPLWVDGGDTLVLVQ